MWSHNLRWLWLFILLLFCIICKSLGEHDSSADIEEITLELPLTSAADVRDHDAIDAENNLKKTLATPDSVNLSEEADIVAVADDADTALSACNIHSDEVENKMRTEIEKLQAELLHHKEQILIIQESNKSIDALNKNLSEKLANQIAASEEQQQVFKLKENEFLATIEQTKMEAKKELIDSELNFSNNVSSLQAEITFLKEKLATARKETEQAKEKFDTGLEITKDMYAICEGNLTEQKEKYSKDIDNWKQKNEDLSRSIEEFEKEFNEIRVTLAGEVETHKFSFSACKDNLSEVEISQEKLVKLLSEANKPKSISLKTLINDSFTLFCEVWHNSIAKFKSSKFVGTLEVVLTPAWVQLEPVRENIVLSGRKISISVKHFSPKITNFLETVKIHLIVAHAYALQRLEPVPHIGVYADVIVTTCCIIIGIILATVFFCMLVLLVLWVVVPFMKSVFWLITLPFVLLLSISSKISDGGSKKKLIPVQHKPPAKKEVKILKPKKKM